MGPGRRSLASGDVSLQDMLRSSQCMGGTELVGVGRDPSQAHSSTLLYESPGRA